MGSEIFTKIAIFDRLEENLRRFFSERYLNILSISKLLFRIQRIGHKGVLKLEQLLGSNDIYTFKRWGISAQDLEQSLALIIVPSPKKLHQLQKKFSDYFLDPKD